MGGKGKKHEKSQKQSEEPININEDNAGEVLLDYEAAGMWLSDADLNRVCIITGHSGDELPRRIELAMKRRGDAMNYNSGLQFVSDDTIGQISRCTDEPAFQSTADSVSKNRSNFVDRSVITVAGDKPATDPYEGRSTQEQVDDAANDKLTEENAFAGLTIPDIEDRNDGASALSDEMREFMRLNPIDAGGASLFLEQINSSIEKTTPLRGVKDSDKNATASINNTLAAILDKLDSLQNESLNQFTVMNSLFEKVYNDLHTVDVRLTEIESRLSSMDRRIETLGGGGPGRTITMQPVAPAPNALLKRVDEKNVADFIALLIKYKYCTQEEIPYARTILSSRDVCSVREAACAMGFDLSRYPVTDIITLKVDNEPDRVKIYTAFKTRTRVPQSGGIRNAPLSSTVTEKRKLSGLAKHYKK